MDKLQRRALGFAVWVILGSHRDPTTRLLRPPAAGFGRSPVPAAHGSDCAYGMAETAAMSHRWLADTETLREPGSRASVFLLSLLLLYYEVYRWIPLGKWNWQFRWPVQNDQFYPDIVIGLLLIFLLVAFLRTWLGTESWVGQREMNSPAAMAETPIQNS